jgi:hypothetical protein
MAYIPKEAKWYIADLVMECQIEGEPRNVVHVDIVLVRADSPEEAFQKAEQLGKEGENSYLNPNNQQVIWLYRGLRDLQVIHDELEHGAELMYEEKIGISEDEVQAIVRAKSQLNVFKPYKPRDISKPDYSGQEVMDQVQRMICDDAGEQN